MSDHSEALVFVDVAEENAPELGERLLAWLVDRGFVARELSDCMRWWHDRARTAKAAS